MGDTNNMDNEYTNPFIVQAQEQEAELARLGLSDMSPFGTSTVRMKAESRIRKDNITDEDEKLKVYAEIKQQYLEYLEYMKGQGKP